MDWIPQNDLLAHEKVRLFITHGGFNSMIETVYHAKPVINFPIIADQINIAAFVVNRGLGIRMYFNQFSVNSLMENIEEVIRNQKYAKRMQAASAIMRDEPATAAEKASNMINHVIKHGDKHLKTGAHQLSYLQYYMFDVFLFICSAVILCCAPMFAFIYCVCKFSLGYIRLRWKLKSEWQYSDVNELTQLYVLVLPCHMRFELQNICIITFAISKSRKHNYNTDYAKNWNGSRSCSC